MIRRMIVSRWQKWQGSLELIFMNGIWKQDRGSSSRFWVYERQVKGTQRETGKSKKLF